MAVLVTVPELILVLRAILVDYHIAAATASGIINRTIPPAAVGDIHLATGNYPAVLKRFATNQHDRVCNGTHIILTQQVGAAGNAADPDGIVERVEVP